MGGSGESVALHVELEQFGSPIGCPDLDWTNTPEPQGDNAPEWTLPWAVRQIQATGQEWPPIIVAFERYGELQ